MLALCQPASRFKFNSWWCFYFFRNSLQDKLGISPKIVCCDMILNLGGPSLLTGGHWPMLCRPFRVIYTVKELDSHAKHGQHFKKRLGSMTELVFLWQKSSFRVRTSFEVFFNHGSCWRKRRWNSLYGHFSRKNAPVHTLERSSTCFIWLHCTGLAREECL